MAFPSISSSASTAAVYPRSLFPLRCRPRFLALLVIILLFLSFQLVIHVPSIRSAVSLLLFSDHLIESKGLRSCPGCHNDMDNTDKTIAYTDQDGRIRLFKVTTREFLSSSIWKNPSMPEDTKLVAETQEIAEEQLLATGSEVSDLSSTGTLEARRTDPIKLKREVFRRERKEHRIQELLQMDKEAELHIRNVAASRSRNFSNKVRASYNIWRLEFHHTDIDSTLRLMKDQIIMAKVYATIAHSQKQPDLYSLLMKCIKQSQEAVGDAHMDYELDSSALERAKAMGHTLSSARDVLYNSGEVLRRLRVMLQSTELNINSVKKQNSFLVQHAAKTVSMPLHCLHMQLTTDYYFQDGVIKEYFRDASLKEKEEKSKPMTMWFISHPPLPATVHVENIDNFKWLNSSYCSVLRQLESAWLKEYYFKAHDPSSHSDGNENLKYRNPKYLSMLNHLRFYMPEIHPKLDKILFLDDDVVVQKDLTPLWDVDLKGMVNGAVETCKESFHRFDTYLNFSHPKISENFDPRACGWAFGMNMFDLREWKRQNITGIYHYWQDLNEDRKLWKLGTLPPGLITFYNLTYPLNRTWHVLGLGYDPTVDLAEIENAAVVHYNGNYKPWLDLAISKYKPYWSKYVDLDNSHVQHCYMSGQ
ncbi:hypothetical protein E2562_003174 [Oryza meyeriana var. granulata]|uniref:Hexosyltransferase n=1 Tax=Oryza meyeriana var. granulata TaxID=110450 RepID=A0A6G1EUV7_9ORYZ|nr:hypothetical protein E2562_003174 [Oryza meyeriana var. granulata]